MPQDAPLLVVDDVLAALSDLAARGARALAGARSSPSPARSARPAPRRRCGSCSARQGETHASAASYNNHWGVPLSLARMPQTRAFGVFEIGMNHAGEITPLTQLVRPHVAIVTTIAPVHLEFFGSLEAIADAKAEIFLGLEPGGAAVLNRRQSRSSSACKRARRGGGRRAHRRRSARRDGADARLIKCVAAGRDARPCRRDILGHDVDLQARRARPARGR